MNNFDFGIISKGNEITDVQVFAQGLGIDDIERLVSTYILPNGKTTDKNDWQKVKGFTRIDSSLAEIHWYQCQNVGKVEFKIKRFVNENEEG